MASYFNNSEWSLFAFFWEPRPKILEKTILDTQGPLPAVPAANVVLATSGGGKREQVLGKLTRVNSGSESKVRAWLDSGANESMFRDGKIAKSLTSSRIRIDTARVGECIDSTQVGEVELHTKDGILLPGFRKVIFSGRLADNLASVGRISDGGYTIVFDREYSYIYESRNIKIEGKRVHREPRDRDTGLYPITLSLAPNRVFGGGSGGVFVQNVPEFWAKTAKAVIERAKNFERFALEPVLELPRSMSENSLAHLSRLYIREDLDELQRWHEKCGHIGLRNLLKLGIDSLKNKKFPEKLSCESCVKGKIQPSQAPSRHGQREVPTG